MVDTDDTRRTTDDGRRTTPGVWHKLLTGELKKPSSLGAMCMYHAHHNTNIPFSFY